MKILIRDAKSKDLPDILKINHSVQYPERQDGFLTIKRTNEDFKKLFKVCKQFLVAEIDKKIIGYFIVLDETADFLESEYFSFYVKTMNRFRLIYKFLFLLVF